MTLTQICQNIVGITWVPSKKHLNGEHRRTGSLQKLIPDECLNEWKLMAFLPIIWNYYMKYLAAISHDSLSLKK